MWSLLATLLPLATLAAAPGAAGASGPVPAGPGAGLAVVAFGQCDEPGLAEVTRELRRELEAREPRTLGEEATARPAGGLRRPSYDEVMRSIEAAAEDFFAQPPRLERAQQTLRAALEDAGRLAPGAQRWQAVTTASAHLARVLLKAGERAKAREIFLGVVAVEPEHTLNKVEYPPSEHEELGLARSLVESIPHVELKVVGPVPGAPVFLNGFPAGNLPFTRRLPVGTYELVVGEPPRLGFAREVTLAADLSVQVDWEREARLHPGFGPCFEASSRDQWLSASALLSSVLGVPRIVAVRFEGTGGEQLLAATLVEVQRGRVVREGKVRSDSRSGPSRLAAFLLTGEEGTGVEVAPSAALESVALSGGGPALDAVASRPAWQRPLAGSLAAAAAILAGVAVWQLAVERDAVGRVQALRQPPHANIREEDWDLARALLDQGGAAHGWMIGTAIGAALAAGASATMFLVRLDPPAPGAPAAAPPAVSLVLSAPF